MVSQARQRLSDDHLAVGEVLRQLLTALNNKDVQVSYSKLDLLWARLGVHIRAEHLHLFPLLISRLTESGGWGNAKSLIEGLRSDHEFFMRELARAIKALRARKTELSTVADTVREIEKRLKVHNELEEDQIYRWATTLLTESEQNELAARITVDLENRPPRFSAEAWANQ